MGNNTVAIHALAQVNSQSWTTDQKIAALNSGLFSEMGVPEQAALRKSLESQKRTEATIVNLQKTASALDAVVAIGTQLGVSPDVIRVAQTGQVVASALAQYAQGNYIGAAMSAMSLLGVGKGATDGNAQMMGYMEKKFGEINMKLDKIIKLQEDTLRGVVVLTQQMTELTSSPD